MIAFVHIHKTAGTTFTAILRRSFGLKHFDRPGSNEFTLEAEHLKRLRWIYWNLESLGGHTIRPFSTLHTAAPSLRYYTFLRDPVKRSISHFTWYLRWKANDGIFFDDFGQAEAEWLTQAEQQNFQCRNLCGQSDPDAAIACLDSQIQFVGIVEQFDTSVLLWRNWAGKPHLDVSYCSLNTSHDRYERLRASHPDYLKRVNEFLRELKASPEKQIPYQRINQGDQKLYDYAVKTVFPRQIEQHPGDLAAELETLKKQNASRTTMERDRVSSRIVRNCVFRPLRHLIIQQ